ncbi:MAG: amidohydrolase family protein [Deltaproteobacteria bacterium]|jgi:hypothetical protein|nr:amidohydrolase family protein [Deltaproteobacteria bacterium]
MTKLLKIILITFTSTLLLFTITCYANPLLIKNVNLIDVTNGRIHSKVRVLIVDGLINQISFAKNLEVPPDNVVDASGTFLIPGLWDMHVHWYDERFLKLFIVNGVTGTRQMLGKYQHYIWRKKQYETTFIGPKTVVGSPILDGKPKFWENSIEIPNAKYGRRIVQQYKTRGADFIKVYNNLDRASYFAIADESKKLGLPFVGHVPFSVTLLEASNVGQKSMEHLKKMVSGTSDSYNRIVAEYRDQEKTPSIELEMLNKILAGYGGDQAKILYSTFVKNNTWQSPTLAISRNMAYLRERSEIDKERLKCLTTGITSHWHANRNPDTVDNTDEDWIFYRKIFKHKQRIVGDMYRTGVKIIAGTDVLNPFCFPGFSLHDELELLVEAGLPPLTALQTATINAAEFLGKTDKYGTIEVGKIADLVLLEDNPLENISNTTKIAGVILNGVFFSKQDLSEMLKKLKQVSGN